MKPFKEAEGFADDLQAAYDYYKSYSNTSAKRFLAGYAEAVKIIQRSPFICRPRRHGWRQMIIQDYPSYSIFYPNAGCWPESSLSYAIPMSSKPGSSSAKSPTHNLHPCF